MIVDIICPECGDEAEIDTAELEGAESIGCEECNAEFAFTIVDGKVVIGAVLEEGDKYTEDDEDDDTEIDVEDDDEDDAA